VPSSPYANSRLNYGSCHFDLEPARQEHLPLSTADFPNFSLRTALHLLRTITDSIQLAGIISR